MKFLSVVFFSVDIATGKSRGIVINTKSFGGQCRKIDSNAYRLPQSLLMYTFLVGSLIVNP